ncbi:MAG TPA: hypothetical protein VFH82_00650 [Gemmatimonadota bacterium]|jgi:hypothetical protein|nr:hypothetical protein [Gemmatimonadota bacterium]
MPPKPGDLAASLLLMAAVVVLAIGGLASDGNWPKVARVATSFLTYVVVLLAARGSVRKHLEGIPYRIFALAGGAAGLASGLVRTEVQGFVLIVGAVAGGLLLGGVHWLGLIRWRHLR